MGSNPIIRLYIESF